MKQRPVSEEVSNEIKNEVSDLQIKKIEDRLTALEKQLKTLQDPSLMYVVIICEIINITLLSLLASIIIVTTKSVSDVLKLHGKVDDLNEQFSKLKIDDWNQSWVSLFLLRLFFN